MYQVQILADQHVGAVLKEQAPNRKIAVQTVRTSKGSCLNLPQSDALKDVEDGVVLSDENDPNVPVVKLENSAMY
jgi:hypothetical protein